MVDIQNYIRLSDSAISVQEMFTTSDKFSKNYKAIDLIEQKSFLRHYFINNCPFLFKTKPLLFEQLLQYLADKLEISPSEVKLIGSAKLGFSISDPPNYGKPFRKESDLDFSIINEDVFLSLQDEFNSWAERYRNKLITPRGEKEKTNWNNNLFEVPKYQLLNGLIDTYKIPSWHEFPFAQKINDSLSKIVINLKNIYSIEVKGASARVYQSWDKFARQIKLNTESVLNKLK